MKCFSCGMEFDIYSKCTPCYDKLGAERDMLREALTKLVNKLFKVHDDPEYTAVWTIYQVHVYGGYKGLTYTKELDEAKQALAQKGGLSTIYEQLAEVTKKLVDYSMEMTDKIIECDTLRAENAELKDENAELKDENAELKDFRGGTIHESWLTESRENLIEALRFQGATTKVLLKEHDELRAENAELRKKDRCPQA